MPNVHLTTRAGGLGCSLESCLGNGFPDDDRVSQHGINRSAVADEVVTIHVPGQFVNRLERLLIQIGFHSGWNDDR